MDDKFSIERIREAQRSLFPDGGYHAVHEVRRRSPFRKFCDQVCRDRLVTVVVILASLFAAILVATSAFPEAVRFVLGSVTGGEARLADGGSGTAEERFEGLSEEEKRAVREFVNGH